MNNNSAVNAAVNQANRALNDAMLEKEELNFKLSQLDDQSRELKRLRNIEEKRIVSLLAYLDQ